MGLFRGMGSTTLREGLQQAVYFPMVSVRESKALKLGPVLQQTCVLLDAVPVSRFFGYYRLSFRYTRVDVRGPPGDFLGTNRLIV